MPTESQRHALAPEPGAPDRRRTDGPPDASVTRLDHADHGHAYNEDAFCYFLGVERRRAERSNRPLLLLLADLKEPAGGTSAPIGSVLATALFAALGQCVRETDFVGWYREGRVVGAVLIQHSDTPEGDMSRSIIGQRVGRTLAGTLSRDIVDRLQVRVYQLPRKLNRS